MQTVVTEKVQAEARGLYLGLSYTSSETTPHKNTNHKKENKQSLTKQTKKKPKHFFHPQICFLDFF